MNKKYYKIDKNGDKKWYLNGTLLHRKNGPAVIYPSGTAEWWIKGKLHRENGPAIEYAGGTGEWRFNGKKHRLDGPAVENRNYREWWINGIKLPNKKVEEWIKDNDIDLKTQEGQLIFKLRWG